MENLFEEEDKAEQKMKEEYEKKIKELESKLGTVTDETGKKEQSWASERKQLEDQLNEKAKRAADADRWDKFVNDNPAAAAKAILDYNAAKDGAAKGVGRGGNGNSGSSVEAERIAKLEERLSKQEKDSQDKAAREYIIEMQNAIGEVMDELKEYGIEADPNVIINHLKDNEYTRPAQVRDGVYGLYRDQVFTAVKKKRSEEKEGVVMGTQGYTSGSENEEEKPLDIEKTDINDLWNTVASKLK